MIPATHAAILEAHLLAPLVARCRQGARLGSVARLLVAQINCALSGGECLTQTQRHLLHVVGLSRAPSVVTARRWLLAAKGSDSKRLKSIRPGRRLPGATS